MTNLFVARLFLQISFLQRILPANLVVRMHSLARNYFLKQFCNQKIDKSQYIISKQLERKLWGITFRSPLMNAAGMFKNGEGYDIAEKFLAGGYIGGTSTPYPYNGNYKDGITHPVIMLAKSHIAINYLGMPNLGDEILAKRSITDRKQEGCPIGWSVTRSPEADEAIGMKDLIQSLWLYHDNSQIDFIEINESCPNVVQDGANLTLRLELIQQQFLQKRKRHLPVVIKFSNDMQIADVPSIVELLIKLGFDGINIGNTSKNYSLARLQAASADYEIFDYFTNHFGGGVSGKFLKSLSLELCKEAVKQVSKLAPNHEFHVIRAGGIDNYTDIIESDKAGISLNQWYTGFFNNYLFDGNKVYQKIYTLCL